MTGSPVPTKDPVVEGDRNLLSRIWVRFFQDLIKDVSSYAAHASRHLTGGSDEVDGDKLDIDWTPTNYTPSTSPSEASSADNLTAHLKGVDTVLGTVSSHASAHITGGSDEVDGDKLDIDWTPSNYTPSTSPTEASNADNLTAHLKGMDTAVGGKASSDHDATHVTSGSDEIDGDKLDIDWTPTNYTPSTSPSEADNADNLTAHLKGIDTLIGTHASRHVTGGGDEVDGDKLDIDWTPTNYTPSTSPSEADNADNLTAHLKGIDTLVGAHASRHITGAADEIDADKADIDWTPTNYTPSTSPSEADNVDNLTAHLKGIDVAIATKASTDHDAGHITGGSDEVDGDKLDIDWTPTNYTPSTSPSEADNVDNLTAHLKGVDTLVGTHASRHQSGGGDAIKLDDLAAPDDNTDLDVSTSKHGLCVKGDNDTSHFLRGDATWAAPAGSGASIVTGTYTGNGSTGQGITGVGFQPKYVEIHQHLAAEGGYSVFKKLDQTWGDYAAGGWTGAAPDFSWQSFDNRVNSLDADGFTVDDDGTDQDPNKDGITYDYLALG